MREKVLLEYDPAAGSIYDPQGNLVGSWSGLVGFEQETDNLLRVKELRQAGFSADDICKLFKERIL